MKKTPIHLDRLARALADQGVALPRTGLLAVAAAAFGCRNVHELAALDNEGGIDPVIPEDMGSHHVLHVGQMKFLRDPSGYIYAVQPEMLEREGRGRGWHIAPFGGLACSASDVKSAHTETRVPVARHDPEVPYMLTDSDCEHIGGREGDFSALGRDFGTFENDFYPLDATEAPYVVGDVVLSDDRRTEVRVGYSAMYRGAKHLAPTAEFRYDDGDDGPVTTTSGQALAEAQSFIDAVRPRLLKIGGDAILAKDSGDVYGEPAHTVMLLIPIEVAVQTGGLWAWHKMLGGLICTHGADGEWPDTLVQGDEYAVTLEYIGEGKEGDYDPKDPDDEPLYRFDVQRMVDGRWEHVEDTSYCTQIRADISPERAEAAARYLLARVEAHGGPRLKRLCEQLSWTSMNDVDQAQTATEERIS